MCDGFCLSLFLWKGGEVKVTQLCPTLCDLMDYSPWNSPGQNAGVGSCSLLQGIFPTQRSNPGLPHRRWIIHHLNHQGGPVERRRQVILLQLHCKDFEKDTLTSSAPQTLCVFLPPTNYFAQVIRKFVCVGVCVFPEDIIPQKYR